MAWEVENPYLDQYRKLMDDRSVDRSPFGFLLSALGLAMVSEADTRESLTRKYGFAIPTQEALDFIAFWSPIVEIGAGTGYWAHLLQQMEVDITAYDKFSGHGQDRYGFGPVWMNVLKGNSAVAKIHPDRTLLLCWPDYQSRFASDCLRNYRGNRLIYIGEGKGGCTGNDLFHDKIKEEWRLIKNIRLPTWPGIRDDLKAYERKELIYVPTRAPKAKTSVRELRAPHLAAPVRRRRSARKRRTGRVPRKGLPVQRVPAAKAGRANPKPGRRK
jgi:hypothetical protein